MHPTLLLPLALLLAAAGADAQSGGIRPSQRGSASVISETGFPSAPQWSFTAPGADFVEVSYATRTGGPPGVACPLQLIVPSLPPGAVLMDAVVSWTYLANDNPMTAAMTINGLPVTGERRGFGSPDLCWGKALGVTYAASGISAWIHVGGANTFDGICDGMLGSDPAALGEGFTLVLIYQVPQDPTIRTVDIFAGYTSTESSPTGDARAELNLSCPYNGGPLHLLVNANDGQLSTDEFHLGTQSVGGIVAGTFSATDAWAGQIGPLATGNLYDVADDDIQAYLGLGDTSLLIESGFQIDCMGHSFAALAYEPEPACIPCSVEFYCNPQTGSPDNVASLDSDACYLGGAVTLTLGGAAPGQATYLLIGNGFGIVTDPPGAKGDLCVSGGSYLGRYSKDIGTTDASGSFATEISNTLTGGPNFGLPQGAGNIQPGETWNFQYWYRVSGSPSAFSAALSVTFH